MPLGLLRRGLFRHAQRFARPAFAVFVLLHLSFQAFRSSREGTPPEPGLEVEPWFVAAVLGIIGLPVLVVCGWHLQQAPKIFARSSLSPQARALAVAELLALFGLLGFMALHLSQFTWPVFSGDLVPADVRPELVRLLSSTSHGLPAQGIAYLSGVGAASFYATRLALGALPEAARVARRWLIWLGVLAYLLGSYAVIRTATGEIF